MSGQIPACYGNNILYTTKHSGLPCLNGHLSLGTAPKLIPISIPYPSKTCTPYIKGCCNSYCSK